MTLQNAPPGLDYERDRRFSKVYLVLEKLQCQISHIATEVHNFAVFQRFGCCLLSKGSEKTSQL